MAQPIPINRSSAQRVYYVNGGHIAPVHYVPAPVAAAWPREAVPGVEGTSLGMALLAVSGFAGSLAVVAALKLWPSLAASHLNVDKQGAFYLLAIGVYLLATTLYAAWRTRLLQDIRRAPWDARLMTYANLGVGGAISLVVCLVFLALVALLWILAWLISLLWGGPQGG